MSRPRNPIWPYLMVLICLFVLSVAAPNSWNRESSEPAVDTPPQLASDTPPISIVRPEYSTSITPNRSKRSGANVWPHLAPRVEQVTGRITNQLQDIAAEIRPRFTEAAIVYHNRELPPVDVVEHLEFAVDEPWKTETGRALYHARFRIEQLAKQAARRWKRSLAAAQSASVDPTVADLNILPAEQFVSTEVTEELATAHDEDFEGPLTHWPRPWTVQARLDVLSADPVSREWSRTVHQLLDRLTAMEVSDTHSAAVLKELRTVTDEATRVAKRAAPDIANQLHAARQEILRRLNVWEQIDVTQHVSTTADMRDAAVDPAMQQHVRAVMELTAGTPQGTSWNDYLLLGRIADLAQRNGEQTAIDRQKTAWQVIRRIDSSQLTAEQRGFLTRPAVVKLESALRTWAAGPIDLTALVHQLETYETTRLASDAASIAQQVARLQWSRSASDQRLGKHLEDQYRNCNMRVVIAAELLNRMLPQPGAVSEPVDDRILGVPTHGISKTSTQLKVRLIPNDRSLQFALEAEGVVDSQTQSVTGPARFNSTGESSYAMRKVVVFGPNGIEAGNTFAEVNSHSHLNSLNTSVDGIPLVRSIVRNYALNQHEKMKPQVRAAVDSKVATRASDRFETETTANLAKLDAEFRRRVLTPLAGLSLDPMVLDMHTDSQRMTARVRLAGLQQLGSHTPRPIAMSNSLASLQLHESLINNMLDRLQLAGRTFTLAELHGWVRSRLNLPKVPAPEELSDHVSVTFSQHDPVRVHCRDGRIELIVAISELDSGSRAWYDFEVKTYYRPDIQGITCEIVRDGTIELGGEEHQGRIDLALRGIFTKIFSRDRKLTIAPFDEANQAWSNLTLTPPTVANGWISFSITEKTTGANVANSTDRSPPAR